MKPDNRAVDEMLRSVLGEQSGIEMAILFGSLATQNAGVESDLDLAVDAGHPLAPEEKKNLIEVLAERSGRPVDLVDLRVVGEPLLGEILCQGRRILGSDESYANLLRRHLFDAADFLPYRNRILEERRRSWTGS